MEEKFFHLENLPLLSKDFINEGLSGNFFWNLSPNTFKCDAPLFKSSQFFKMLEENFGRCNASYFKNLPYSLYDWHTDAQRESSINWVIKTNLKAATIFRDYLENDPYSKELVKIGKKALFWKTYEVDYTLYQPTLLRTTIPHCVFNNSPEERIILSVSVHEATYEDLKNFLKDLKIPHY